MAVATRIIRDPFYSDLAVTMQRMDDFVTRAFGGNGRHWLPMIDVVETTKEYRIFVDLPLIDKETLVIEYEDGVLTLSGKRTRPEGVEFIRVERPYGEFVRSLTLAKGIDSEAITADYHDGVLEIHVPKPAKLQPKKIALTAFSGRP